MEVFCRLQDWKSNSSFQVPKSKGCSQAPGAENGTKSRRRRTGPVNNPLVQACCRELGERQVSHRRMGTSVVVFVPVLPAQHLGFQQAHETLHIEELVAKPRIKALAVAVLPRRTLFDEEAFEPLLRDPVLHSIGYELRSVVRTDELWNAALRDKFIEGFDHVAARHRALHFQRQAFAGELIKHWKPFEPTSRFGLVEHVIIAPDVVDSLCLQALRSILRIAQTPFLAGLRRHPESFHSPSSDLGSYPSARGLRRGGG